MVRQAHHERVLRAHHERVLRASETSSSVEPQFMISAVLTAAGLSSRMGRPKPLLQWRGATLVERQVSVLLEGGASEVVVVLGHRSEEVIPYVERAGASYVVNERYEEGRTSSIKAGLAAVPAQTEDVVLLGVDQPRTGQIVRRVVDAHIGAGALLTLPEVRGTRRTPVDVLDSSHAGAQADLGAEPGAARGVRAAPRRDHGGPLRRSDGPAGRKHAGGV